MARKVRKPAPDNATRMAPSDGILKKPKRTTSKSAWTGLERKIAEGLSKVFGVTTTRTPLSGMNSGHGPGDVIIPLGYDMIVEAKYRAKHAHHSLYEAAVADGKKHGITGKNTLLYTKVKGDHGALVTLDMDRFHDILSVPGVMALFAKPSELGLDSKR